MALSVSGFQVAEVSGGMEKSDRTSESEFKSDPEVPGRQARRRTVPLVVATVIVLTGLLFVFFSDPVLFHSQTWVDQSDLWGIFRGAHYVSWGYPGGVYNQETGIVTLPGIAVLLAPVAMISDALHLSVSMTGFVTPHPTADLLLVPIELILATTAVFAADALAWELGVPGRLRLWMCVAVGVVLWPTVAIWGHPEDSLTMTFALYAMISVLRMNWVRAGWLFGVAIVFQPLIALVIPIFLAASPRGGRVLFAVRTVLASALLVAIAAIGNPSGAFRALVVQPALPTLNHTTPWLAFASPLDTSHQLPLTGIGLQRVPTTGAFRSVVVSAHPLLEVAGSPGRTIYMIMALIVGLVVWRRRPSTVRMLWLAGLVLSARCFFEAVMTPYYLAPPLILLLVVAATCRPGRFAAVVVLSFGVSGFAYLHLGPYEWWLPIVASLAMILGITIPPQVDMLGPTISARPQFERAPD